jgi:site-specific DNA-cytosine methylase
MKVLDLFSGTGSSTLAFERAGCSVYRVELDPQHTADLHADILALSAPKLIELCNGRPDFIWASPPCTSFSVASIGAHWGGGFRAYQPKSDAARLGLKLVAHTLTLIRELAPEAGWIMENPRGVIRKLPVLRGVDRRTVTY